jgi:hypothetical protein
MSGCWTMSRGPLIIEEHWSKPAGGTMLGFSRTLKGGRMVFHEFMRIQESDRGIQYVARIGPESAGTPFSLTRLSEGAAEFENKAHDFPQKIVYRLVSSGELHARIEGMDKGKPRAEAFPMKRAACE